MNGEFEKGSGRETERGCLYQQVHSELNVSIFPKQEGDIVEMDVYCEDKEYRAELRRVSVRGLQRNRTAAADAGRKRILYCGLSAGM